MYEPSESQRKVGRQVRLKSGGPDMVVIQNHEESGSKTAYVECAWFDEKVLRRHWFRVECLYAVREDTSSSAARNAPQP